MIDRRKVAPILLVLGAGLAAVGSFSDTYRTIYPGFGGPDQTLTTTLWVVTTEPQAGTPPDAYLATGWPVIIAAGCMVVAAVLAMRPRTSFIGTPAAMGAAGALAGIVLAYVIQVRREKEIMASWPADSGKSPVLTFLGGTYLLVVAAIVGLVGAALVQRKQQRELESEETAVVVHQFGGDDDTPPFGIAVLGDDQQRETR